MSKSNEEIFKEQYNVLVETSVGDWLKWEHKDLEDAKQAVYAAMNEARKDAAIERDEEIERLKGLIELAFSLDATQISFKKFKAENNI